MATNVELATMPNFWTSAADDIIYTFSFKRQSPFLFADNGGFLQFQLFAAFPVTAVVGDSVFIDNPAFFGTHKIKSIDGVNIYTLETAYVAPTVTLTYIYHLRMPEFSFYKGFKSTESGALFAAQPIELVSIIKPSVSYDENTLPYIKINVKSLANRLFDIQPNTVANSIDYNTFTGLRLEWDGQTTIAVPGNFDFNLVLNSAITNDELLNLITLGTYLTPIDKPFIANKGITFVSAFTINSTYPVLLKYINGVLQ